MNHTKKIRGVEYMIVTEDGGRWRKGVYRIERQSPQKTTYHELSKKDAKEITEKTKDTKSKTGGVKHAR